MISIPPEEPHPINLLSVVGTRPEAIKIAPVALAAAADPRLRHRTLATGQHDLPFDEAFAAFGLAPDERLTLDRDALPATIGARTRAYQAAIGAALDRLAPDIVIVQGDTTSAYAAARAAHGRAIPVAHVEAGLRSGDPRRPWPEEVNRLGIDALAALLFAPTPEAAANLAQEGRAGAVVITGNTGIDALLAMRARLAERPSLSALDRLLGGDARPLILVTCHRREAWGAPLEAICAALLALADRGDVHLLLPLHSNDRVRAPLVARLGRHPAIRLVAALDYPTMVDAMVRARAILSDSGGVQEEAPALGTPVLVLREVTERPEGLASGNLRLVGHDAAAILREATRLIADDAAHAAMARPAFPFGDGRAAARILAAIAAHLGA